MAAEEMFPNKMYLFRSVSICDITVVGRVEEIGSNIKSLFLLKNVKIVDGS